MKKKNVLKAIRGVIEAYNEEREQDLLPKLISPEAFIEDFENEISNIREAEDNLKSVKIKVYNTYYYADEELGLEGKDKGDIDLVMHCLTEGSKESEPIAEYGRMFGKETNPLPDDGAVVFVYIYYKSDLYQCKVSLDAEWVGDWSIRANLVTNPQLVEYNKISPKDYELKLKEDSYCFDGWVKKKITK